MHRRTFLSLVIVAFLSTAIFTAAAGQNERPERESNLEGFIYDVTTEEPVSGMIHIRGTPEMSFMLTIEVDETGVFEAHVPAGIWHIIVESRGYHPIEKRIEVVEGDPIGMRLGLEPVEDGQGEAPGAPDPNVFGKVMDEDGNPIKAIVAFLAPNDETVVLETQRDGKFSIPLPQGAFPYEVRARGYDPVRGIVDVPATGSIRLPIVMEKTDDSETPEHGVLFGKVVDPEGNPIPGAMIFLEPMPTDRVIRPQPTPVETSSGRDGTFKIRLRFGMYMMMVEAEGFHPYCMELAVTPDDPEVRAFVEMEPMEMECPLDFKIHFEYVDSNSDGTFEKIHLTVNIDMDEEPELVLTIIDRNGDGNPESIIFDMDIPHDLIVHVMEVIKMKIGFLPPFLKERFDDDYDRDHMGDRDDWKETKEEGKERIRDHRERLRDWVKEKREELKDEKDDEKEEWKEKKNEQKDDKKEEKEREKDNDPSDGKGTKEKSSILASEGTVSGMLLAIGVLLIVVLIIAITGYAIRKKKDRF